MWLPFFLEKVSHRPRSICSLAHTNRQACHRCPLGQSGMQRASSPLQELRKGVELLESLSPCSFEKCFLLTNHGLLERFLVESSPLATCPSNRGVDRDPSGRDVTRSTRHDLQLPVFGSVSALHLSGKRVVLQQQICTSCADFRHT